MSEELLPGYNIRRGSTLDKALLVKFMQWTYQEAFPQQDFSHLARTVEQYLSRETPLWWVDFVGVQQEEAEDKEITGQGGVGRVGGVEGVGEVERENTSPTSPSSPTSPTSPTSSSSSSPIGCLWVGNAIDQIRGDRHAHIFLLYVTPEHRRQGIGTALMGYGENWAKARGDRQIALQVFQTNTAALNLYNQLNYQTKSLWMVKSLDVTEK